MKEDSSSFSCSYDTQLDRSVQLHFLGCWNVKLWLCLVPCYLEMLIFLDIFKIWFK